MPHKIAIIDKDGNQSEVTIPDFAMDATQERLIKSVQALGKMDPKTAKAYEDLIDATKKTLTATEDASDQQKKDAKALQDTVQNVGDKQVSALRQFRMNFADRVGRDMRDTFTAGGNILTAAIKTATVGLAAGAGLLYKTFMDTSDAFRNLAQSGLGGAGASGAEAQDAVAELTRLGMSASEAASLLTSFSQASAMLGKANFAKFISGIANASSFAANLGLTLEEAAEFAAEEVSIRQRGLAQDFQLTAMNRQTVEESIRQTQRFSSVMGRSMKDINDSRKDFFQDNANIDALMMRFSGARGERLNAELNLMISAAAAIPGAYETLTKGLLNAAAAPIPILDPFIQSIADLGPLVGNLYNDTLDISQQIQSGQLSGEAAIKAINRSLLAIDNDTVRLLQFQAQEGNATAAMVISARTAAAKSAADQEQAFKQAAAANDAMVTAGVNFQNQLNRLSGVFTTVRNNVLGQFAEPLTKMLDQFELSDKALEDHNKQREAAIKADKTLSDQEKAQRIAALRQKSVTEALYDGLTKIANSFMKKFFPNIDQAGDGVGQFIDMVVLKVDEFLTEIDNFINRIEGDTTSEKIESLIKGLLKDVVFPAIKTAFVAGIKALWEDKEILATIIGIFAVGSIVRTAFSTGISMFWKWALGQLALKFGMTAAATTAATTAATGTTAATTAAGATGLAALAARGSTGLAQTGTAVRSLATRGAPLATRAAGLGVVGSGLMVGKDAFDIGASLYKGESVKGEDVGGVIGGVVGGAIGLLGGPVGVAIGASLGNMAGNWIGGFFDDDEAEAASAEVAQQTKEELLQQNGLVAMAIDPEHVREVGRALAFFNAISVTEIANGIATLNPSLAAFYETIQGIRVSFVDNVNTRLNRLLEILTGLNTEGLKLPTTSEHLSDLAARITSMPIEKIVRLGNAISILSDALEKFTSLTTSTAFGRAWDSFAGTQDTTEDVIKILNNFADKVDSEKLLKAAQATMAFNAGMAGAVAVPEQPTTTSPATAPGTPADQVNNAATMQYNNPYNKMRDVESELIRLNAHIRDSVIPALNSIKTNTAED